MRIKDGFMLREVGGAFVVVPVGERSEEFNGMINMNGLGAFLWKELQTERTRNELVEAVLNSYEVEEERARYDVDAFLHTLEESGFVA